MHVVVNMGPLNPVEVNLIHHFTQSTSQTVSTILTIAKTRYSPQLMKGFIEPKETKAHGPL